MALRASYSMAFTGSIGRFEGRGDISSGSASSSDPEGDSESDEDSDSDCDSGDDTDSKVERPCEAVNELTDLGPDGRLGDFLSFFNMGPRAALQGPFPFST